MTGAGHGHVQPRSTVTMNAGDASEAWGTVVMVKRRKIQRRRNLVAHDLKTPKYRQRIVKSKKFYTRKEKSNDGIYYDIIHSDFLDD